MQSILPVFGRVLLSLLFFYTGFAKITGFEGQLDYMTGRGMPASSLLLLAAILFELAGALSLLLGYRIRTGALLLIVYLIPTTLIFHTAWGENPRHIIDFFKNLALIGGLLYTIACGAGPFSLDARREKALRGEAGEV